MKGRWTWPAPVPEAPTALVAATPIDAGAMADVHARLLPSLQDAMLAQQLRGELSDVSERLAAGQVAAALKSIARAEKLLDSYETQGGTSITSVVVPERESARRRS